MTAPASFRLSRRQNELLTERARELGVSRSALVRRLLDQGLASDLIGDVERHTRANVEAVPSAHPMRHALAAGAVRLARALDYSEGQALGPLSKELRATLSELLDR